MSCETHCCSFLRGEVFIADEDGVCDSGLPEITCEGFPSPYRKLGNVLSLNINMATTTIGRENKYNHAGSLCPRTSIQGVTLDMTIGCTSYNNMVQALFSTKDEAEDSTKIDQFCISSLSECDFFPFSKMQADVESLSVFLKDEEGDVVKTLDIDVDYVFSRSGIKIINPSIDLEGGVTLNLSYDYDSQGFLELDFGSEKKGYKSLFFKGTNYAENGDALFDVRIHRVLFKPMGVLPLISSGEILNITLQGVLEKVDGSYFKVIKQE